MESVRAPPFSGVSMSEVNSRNASMATYMLKPPSMATSNFSQQRMIPNAENIDANAAATAPPSQQGSPTPGRIFANSPIEVKDELDDRHEKCYSHVLSITGGKSPKEAFDALTSLVGKDARAHDDICLGLVVGVLSVADEQQAAKHFRDLMLICRDGLANVLTHLTLIVLEKFPKLHPVSKQQLLWLIKELVKNNVVGMDSVVWNLMRQIAGGDVTRNNLWLADSLLDIFIEHRAWLDKFPFLVASVAYTYVRLIEDHFQPFLEKLLEKEVQFVVPLIRERFSDVIGIGRDFVRVLQNVAKIPEFESIWKDLTLAPKSLCPTLTGGVAQLMEIRTSRRYLQLRITPEMEKKLVFLTSQVRFGSHKRYQDWFQRQYLSTPESQTLRCDLIRFIVGVIHPSNELLCSDIIPRWAVIGWLLTTCTSQLAAGNAKLALFYDWLFFQPEKDNIMNIEPAILVMHHSIKPHPAITATLLDFLCRIVTHFYRREQDKVRNGIYNSLRQILVKRVLPSLSPLFDNPKLDPELLRLLRERFSPFVENGADVEPDLSEINEPGKDYDPHEGDGGAEFSDDDTAAAGEDAKGNGEAAMDDSDEESLPLSDSVKLGAKRRGSNTRKTDQETAETSTTTSALARRARKRPAKHSKSELPEDAEEAADLGDQVRRLLADLKTTSRSRRIFDDDDDEVIIASKSDDEVKCEIMDKLLREIIVDDFGYEQCTALASELSSVLSPQFEGKIYPGGHASQELIEESIGKPLFVAFRFLCDLAEDGETSEGGGILLQVLADLYAKQPRVGYYLLYFLSVDKRQEQKDAKSKAAVYKDLCETIDPNYSLESCLVKDMRQCQEDDVDLFVHLVSQVYSVFPSATLGNLDLLYLLVSCVDGRHVQTLVCQILPRRFVLFKKENMNAVIMSSLGWETFEQCVLWQLLLAHGPSMDTLLAVLPKLNADKNPEALTSIALRIRSERPGTDLVRSILQRDSKDRFAASLLLFWVHDYEDKLAELVASYLSKLVATGSSSSTSSGNQSSRRKRGGASDESSSFMIGTLPRRAELVLSHLDEIRQATEQYDFFSHQSIEKSLKSARKLCNDMQKKKYMDLFALVDADSTDDEDDGIDHSYQPSRGTKRTKRSEEDDASSHHDNKRASNKGSSSNSSANSRKRGSKVSYKEMLVSSDESSDDDVSSGKRSAAKKRRKKANASDSD